MLASPIFRAQNYRISTDLNSQRGHAALRIGRVHVHAARLAVQPLACMEMPVLPIEAGHSEAITSINIDETARGSWETWQFAMPIVMNSAYQHKRVVGLSGNEICCLKQLGMQPDQLCVGNSVMSLGVARCLNAGLGTLLGGEVSAITGLVH